jgi:hypothetical protein
MHTGAFMMTDSKVAPCTHFNQMRIGDTGPSPVLWCADCGAHRDDDNYTWVLPGNGKDHSKCPRCRGLCLILQGAALTRCLDCDGTGRLEGSPAKRVEKLEAMITAMAETMSQAVAAMMLRIKALETGSPTPPEE